METPTFVGDVFAWRIIPVDVGWLGSTPIYKAILVSLEGVPLNVAPGLGDSNKPWLLTNITIHPGMILQVELVGGFNPFEKY